MKVILTSDVKNVGKKNQVVEIADGYAKNFILKNKLGVIYTPESSKILNKTLENLAEEHDRDVSLAKLIKNEIESKTYHFYLKANGDKVFGHISNLNIINEINSQKELVNKKMFTKVHNFELGEFTVDVHVHKEVIAKVKIIVSAE